MIRIGFWGTPTLARAVLSDLFADPRFEVVFVVTNPDRSIGRSGELRPSPVKELGQEKGIPVFQPGKVRGNTEFLEQIRAFSCDYFIVVAYGKILPKEVLDIPKKMCINVHGSLLPKYRGASPIQAALFHGDRETGVTIMEMSEAMDEGDILSIEKISIGPDETSGSLFEKFATISGKTLIDTIIGYEKGEIQPVPQGTWIPAYGEGQKVPEPSYCKKIEKEDGRVDWSKGAEEIYHQWQAYTPWPGIYTVYDGKRLLLERVSWDDRSHEGGLQHGESTYDEYLIQDSEKIQKIGQVVKGKDESIGVLCGKGVLTLEQVKLEGKKSQNIRDFVNGNQGFISSIFSYEKSSIG